jgi:glyoxylase-like metal-dependent hydrolase (beta-lactamase superfamily II)
MRIHHLNCATMCPLGERLIQGTGSLLSKAKMVCHCWLVETEHDGLVLVDTGIGLDDCADVAGRLGGMFRSFARPLASREETAARQVERLGFSRRDVRHIVPTHLDLDHAGGLPDFPEATVHVFRPEHDAVMRRATRRERERYRPAHFSHGPKWRVHDVSGERWNGFDAVRTLSNEADVLLVPLEGHTRGHCGVAVRSENGWLLHAGDAYFHEDEMNPTPSCPPALALFQRMVAMDDARRRENQARLRSLVARASDVRVHSAHSATEFERFAHASTARRPVASGAAAQTAT